MIFIFWHIFIFVEVLIHWFVIEVIGYDPTPDNQKWWQAIPETGLRFVVYLILYWTLGIKHNAEFICFTLGCFFSHLLWFGPVLNKSHGEKWTYLGKGFFDKLLGLFPNFRSRILTLILLSASAIYTYYNTDLL